MHQADNLNSVINDWMMHELKIKKYYLNEST